MTDQPTVNMNIWATLSILLSTLALIPYAVYTLIFLFTLPKSIQLKQNHYVPTVSIVLPTFNESSIIEKKLNNLCSLDYPLDKIEVVVVDSSTDTTREIISSFFNSIEFPKLKLIKEPKRAGLAIALNMAYSETSNDIVIKTDCDSLLDRNSIKAAVANFSNANVGAVTGTNSKVIGGSKVESDYRNIQFYVQLLESHFDSTFIFHGPFSAFRRNCIVPVEKDSLADDTELALKIRRQNLRVVFDPNIKFQEASHSSFWKRRMQKDRRAMGLVQVLLRNKDMVGNYGLYGRFVIPSNWWFLIISPWIIFLSMASIAIAIFSIKPLFILPLVFLIIFSIWLGQKDSLGPLQMPYALFDTQVSLLRSHLLLLTKKNVDGIWEVDPTLRELFK